MWFGPSPTEPFNLGVRGAFQAFGRPDAQKVLVLLAGGPPEDAPFEKAWVLGRDRNDSKSGLASPMFFRHTWQFTYLR